VCCCIPLLNGCSLLFASGPPDGHQKLRYFDCPSNAAAPATDAFVGGTYALALLLAAASAGDETAEFYGFVGGVSAAFLGSMAYGIVKNSECSDAKRHLERRLAASERDTTRRIAELQRLLYERAARDASAAQPTVDPQLQPATPPPVEPPPARQPQPEQGEPQSPPQDIPTTNGGTSAP
jgi:hypothetical protein